MTVHEQISKYRDLIGQLWRYGVTGLANTALGYGLILLCVYAFGASILVANIIGYGAGWCLSYTLNKRWTFRHEGGGTRAAIGFVLLAGSAFVANVAITIALTEAGMAYAIAQIVGAVTYSVSVFIGLKWMVFRNA